MYLQCKSGAMQYLLNVIRQTRENFIKLVEASTIEELNTIPAGFNNNMIWNFGHIVASQQGLCYQAANLEPLIETQYILPYKKGTKPEAIIGVDEIDSLKAYMRTTIDHLAEDLDNGTFTSYNAFTTAYGVNITSTTEAVQFFAVHDSYHFGIASAIKKVINNK